MDVFKTDIEEQITPRKCMQSALDFRISGHFIIWLISENFVVYCQLILAVNQGIF